MSSNSGNPILVLVDTSPEGQLRAGAGELLGAAASVGSDHPNPSRRPSKRSPTTRVSTSTTIPATPRASRKPTTSTPAAASCVRGDSAPGAHRRGPASQMPRHRPAGGSADGCSTHQAARVDGRGPHPPTSSEAILPSCSRGFVGAVEDLVDSATQARATAAASVPEVVEHRDHERGQHPGLTDNSHDPGGHLVAQAAATRGRVRAGRSRPPSPASWRPPAGSWG